MPKIDEEITMIDQTNMQSPGQAPKPERVHGRDGRWMTVAVWSILAITGVIIAGMLAYIARQRGLGALLGSMYLLGPLFCFISIGKIGQKTFSGRWRSWMVVIGIVGMLGLFGTMVWAVLTTSP